MQTCLRRWAETSQDQKVVVGECKAGGELGKLRRPAGGIAIAVVKQLTCIGFVDDAVAGILGGAGCIGDELRRCQRARAHDRREDRDHPG